MKSLTLLFAVLLSTSDLLAQLRPPAIPPTSADALTLLGKPTRSVNVDAMVAKVLKNPNPAARTNLINFTRRTLTNPADLKKFDAAIAAAIGPARVAQPAPATPQPSPATATSALQQPAAATSSGTAKPQAARPTATVRAHDIPDLLKEYSELLDRKRYTSHDDASAVLASRGSSDGEVAALKTLLQNKAKLAQEESAIREKLKLAEKLPGFSERLLEVYGQRYQQAILMEDLVRQRDPRGLPIARKAFLEAEKDLQNHPLYIKLMKDEQAYSALSNTLNQQQRSGQEPAASQLDQLQQAAETAFTARKKMSVLKGMREPNPVDVRDEAGSLLASRRLKVEASPDDSAAPRPIEKTNPDEGTAAAPTAAATPVVVATQPKPTVQSQPAATVAAQPKPVAQPQPPAVTTQSQPTVEPSPIAQPQPAAPVGPQLPTGYPVSALSPEQTRQLQAFGQQYGFPPYKMLLHPYASTAGLEYMFKLAQYVRSAPDYSAVDQAVASLPQEHKESLGVMLDSLRTDRPVVESTAPAAQPQPAVQPGPAVATQPYPAVAELPPDYPTSVLTPAQQEELASLGQQYGFPPYTMLYHPVAATTSLDYVFQVAKYVREAADDSAIEQALENIPPEHHESFGALLRSTRRRAAAAAPPQGYGHAQNEMYPVNAPPTEPGFGEQPPQEYEAYDQEPIEPTPDFAAEELNAPEERHPAEENYAAEPPVDSEEALEQLGYGSRNLIDAFQDHANRLPTKTERWMLLPGLAQDIAIGGDGSVYIVATASDESEFGFGVYKWNGDNWIKTQGDAVKIAVDAEGNPWLINKHGQIWRRILE